MPEVRYKLDEIKNEKKAFIKTILSEKNHKK